MNDRREIALKDRIIDYFRILRTKQGFKTFTAVAMAVGVGLLAGLLVLIVANPGKSFFGFLYILIGPFGDRSPMIGIGEMLYYTTPILFTGLSVGFAFKTGMFNIGASGQFMVGQCAALYVAFYGQSLGAIQWVVAVIAGILAGALWGFFVGLFKALFNVNEVITAIMFNYIGLNLVNILVRGNPLIYDLNRARSYKIPAGARLPDFGLQSIFPGSSVDIGIIIAILVAIMLYIVLNKTTFGYELKAVGLNKNASRYAGINDKKSIILSMSIAGALSGLGGALQILSPGVITAGKSLGKEYTPTDIVASEGFNGIPVALLGLSNPIAIIFSAIFVTYLQRLNYPIEIIDIIIAIIIYFSAFAILMRNILASAISRRKDKKAFEDSTIDHPDIDNGGAV